MKREHGVIFAIYRDRRCFPHISFGYAPALPYQLTENGGAIADNRFWPWDGNKAAITVVGKGSPDGVDDLAIWFSSLAPLCGLMQIRNDLFGRQASRYAQVRDSE
ncbi:MAG: hypothetical protein ABSD38_01120 [Syntrophorhabdales bacterium]